MRLHRKFRNAALACAVSIAAATPARAVVIELTNAGSDRVERQRAAYAGNLPLPGTPDVTKLGERLAARQMVQGAPVLIRIFKESSELEVWLQKGDRFELFAIYPICQWSGVLGPKLHEGDKQTPEGIYTIGQRQLHRIGRWPRSLNLGFPNILDRSLSRTGSYILIHGGCSSVGCFAMTNPVIHEIYDLTQAALAAGQDHVQVHVFPFRMTDNNLARHSGSEWSGFWRSLKEAHDIFEQSQLPPRVSICEGRYRVESAKAEEVAGENPLVPCGVSYAANSPSTQAGSPTSANPSQRPSPSSLLSPNRVPALPADYSQLAPSRGSNLRAQRLALLQQLPPGPSRRNLVRLLQLPGGAMTTTRNQDLGGGRREPIQLPQARTAQASSKATANGAISCEISLPSCRKWFAAMERRAGRSLRSASAGTISPGGLSPRTIR